MRGLIRLSLVVAVALTAARMAGAAGTGYIFVSNEMDDTVTVLDGTSYEPVKLIAVGRRPRDMRFHLEKTDVFEVL